MRKIHAQVWQTPAGQWNWTLYTDGEPIQESNNNPGPDSAEASAMEALGRHITRYKGPWEAQSTVTTYQPPRDEPAIFDLTA